MRTVVVDASIVLGWYLKDEGCGEEALALLEAYVKDEVHLMAPVLLEYEVLNGLLMAARRGRLDVETARQAYRGFRALGLELVDSSTDGENVLSVAEDSGLSAYDGAYLALALKEKAELATTDKSLAAAARKERIVLS